MPMYIHDWIRKGVTVKAAIARKLLTNAQQIVTNFHRFNL